VSDQKLTPADLRKLADLCERTPPLIGKGVVEKLRQAADEIERLQVPYCLGRTTIEAVADQGQLVLDSGHAFIAASDLFKQNPYERLTAATADPRTLKRLRLADKLATVTASYRKACKTGEERAKRGIEVDKAVEEYRAAVEGK
jgi:hypothetical protein